MAGSNEERNAEIWSTRIQKELLALTTDNAGKEVTEEIQTMLPSFVKVKEHTLDIGRATCTVSFAVEITKSKIIVIQLDASMPKKPDGRIDVLALCYPFAAPIPTLEDGSENFARGSTIQVGEKILMDLDWTPSLHLTDAIMNIALKIKESILQNEPFHPLSQEPERVTADAVMNARRFAANMTRKSLSSIKGLAQPNPRSSGRRSQAPKKQKNKSKTPSEVQIGDEINLLEEPWVEARGVYSCKAIRRPAFVTEAMEIANQKAEQQSFSSPTAMFRSFTQSARSVLEEGFLMVTETHIIELKSSKLSPSNATVVFAVSIDLMAKLKFRRQESLSLFFKPAPEDPLVYMCPDSGDAVHQIQTVLKRYGVRGKHTNAAAYRAISEALQLVQEIQTKELALKHDPTTDRVNEIMDLYRQAAERFELAGDVRHAEVVTHMRKFLARPLTVSILDGSYKKPESVQVHPKGEGEILERTPEQLNALEDDQLPAGSKSSQDEDKAFEQNMEDLMKEAQKDFEQFKIDGDETNTASTAPSTGGDTNESDPLEGLASDLDAMMREADKELAELMSS